MAWTRTESRHARGYGTAWDKLRPIILARDNYLCQPCLRKDILTPANIVDHITPKAQGGTDDPSNLQTICEECHTIKTTIENGGRVKTEYKASGLPANPQHPWNDVGGGSEDERSGAEDRATPFEALNRNNSNEFPRRWIP